MSLKVVKRDVGINREPNGDELLALSKLQWELEGKYRSGQCNPALLLKTLNTITQGHMIRRDDDRPPIVRPSVVLPAVQEDLDWKKLDFRHGMNESTPQGRMSFDGINKVVQVGDEIELCAFEFLHDSLVRPAYYDFIRDFFSPTRFMVGIMDYQSKWGRKLCGDDAFKGLLKDYTIPLGQIAYFLKKMDPEIHNFKESRVVGGEYFHSCFLVAMKESGGECPLIRSLWATYQRGNWIWWLNCIDEINSHPVLMWLPRRMLL